MKTSTKSLCRVLVQMDAVREFDLKFVDGEGVREDGEYFNRGEVIKELKSRGVPLPIPVVPAPKILIVLPIDVKPRKSEILVPDSVRAPDEAYSTHPMQAWVVAIDPELNIPGLEVGSKVYMKILPTEIFRYKDVNYRFINYSFIIGYE